MISKKSYFILSYIIYFALPLKSQTNTDFKHSVGMQFLGPAIFTTQYEFNFFDKEKFSISTDLGFGRAEYSDDGVNPPTPGTRVLNTGILIESGLPRLKLIASVFSSTYFHGRFSFVNLNSLFGLRCHVSKERGISILAAYAPNLYTSITTDTYYFTHFDFCLRVTAHF